MKQMIIALITLLALSMHAMENKEILLFSGLLKEKEEKEILADLKKGKMTTSEQELQVLIDFILKSPSLFEWRPTDQLLSIFNLPRGALAITTLFDTLSMQKKATQLCSLIHVQRKDHAQAARILSLCLDTKQTKAIDVANAHVTFRSSGWPDTRTLLDWAITTQNLPCAVILLKYHADPNKKATHSTRDYRGGGSYSHTNFPLCTILSSFDSTNVIHRNIVTLLMQSGLQTITETEMQKLKPFICQEPKKISNGYYCFLY